MKGYLSRGKKVKKVYEWHNTSVLMELKTDKWGGARLVRA